MRPIFNCKIAAMLTHDEKFIYVFKLLLFCNVTCLMPLWETQGRTNDDTFESLSKLFEEWFPKDLIINRSFKIVLTKHLFDFVNTRKPHGFYTGVNASCSKTADYFFKNVEWRHLVNRFVCNTLIIFF